jgi:hypothetical protein
MVNLIVLSVFIPLMLSLSLYYLQMSNKKQHNNINSYPKEHKTKEKHFKYVTVNTRFKSNINKIISNTYNCVNINNMYGQNNALSKRRYKRLLLNENIGHCHKKSLKANIEGSTQISISDNVRVIYQ